jgi:hypothetical protein
MFAIQNIADELSPCASIILNLDWSPSFKPVTIPASINLIWPIDEYAINDFISGCRMHISDVNTPPTNAMTINKIDIRLFNLLNNMIIRASPYPPNFNKIAARIIEPATGAST